MTTRHTPGPWVYGFTEGNMPFADVWTLDKHPTGPGHETEHRLHLATVYTDGADDGNARLIAAAPELLDGAERSLALLEAGMPSATALIKDLRAAIAKATGDNTK